MNQQLLDYIKESREGGITDELTRKALIENKWQMSDIEEHFRIADSTGSNMSNSDYIVPQRKLINKFTIIILVIVLIILGVSVFWFLDRQYNWNILNQSNDIENNLNAESFYEPEDNSNVTVGELEQNSEPETPIEPKRTDCGSISTDVITKDFSERPDHENEALRCYSLSIFDCDKAIIGFIYGDDYVEILGKEGDTCLINNFTPEGGNRLCKMPMSLINGIETYISESTDPDEHIEDLYTPFAFMMAFGEAEDIQTGEKIIIECVND